MRAMTMTQFGGPEVLKLQEMPEPELKPTDLLVEVHAAALNPVDTKIRQGMLGERPFPLIPGYDVSGVVKAVGDGVDPDAFKVGEEVYASPSLARHGSNAEYVAVDYRSVARKPNSLNHAEAAALPLVTLTAWESLHDRARIHDGESVLIHAGAGGVGHVALQLAKLHDCRVITTASREESIELCKRFGADQVINYKEEDFAERVMKDTENRGLPVIFDTVGEPVFDKSLDCVAVNGRLVTIVYNENPRVVSALFRKNATVHMEFMGVPGIYGLNMEHQGEILRTAAELAEAGKLRPHIHRTFSLEEVAEAHKEQETGHVNGKIVIRVK